MHTPLPEWFRTADLYSATQHLLSICKDLTSKLPESPFKTRKIAHIERISCRLEKVKDLSNTTRFHCAREAEYKRAYKLVEELENH